MGSSTAFTVKMLGFTINPWDISRQTARKADKKRFINL
jgi:hypothetical protein